MYKIARNCLAYMLDYIAMQMRKTNREKDYWNANNSMSEIESFNELHYVKNCSAIEKISAPKQSGLDLYSAALPPLYLRLAGLFARGTHI